MPIQYPEMDTPEWGVYWVKYYADLRFSSCLEMAIRLKQCSAQVEYLNQAHAFAEIVAYSHHGENIFDIGAYRKAMEREMETL